MKIKRKNKTEELTKLLKERVAKLFDREPNGSIQEGELAKLVKEIERL